MCQILDDQARALGSYDALVIPEPVQTLLEKHDEISGAYRYSRLVQGKPGEALAVAIEAVFTEKEAAHFRAFFEGREDADYGPGGTGRLWYYFLVGGTEVALLQSVKSAINAKKDSSTSAASLAEEIAADRYLANFYHLLASDKDEDGVLYLVHAACEALVAKAAQAWTRTGWLRKLVQVRTTIRASYQRAESRGDDDRDAHVQARWCGALDAALEQSVV